MVACRRGEDINNNLLQEYFSKMHIESDDECDYRLAEEALKIDNKNPLETVKLEVKNSIDWPIEFTKKHYLNLNVCPLSVKRV